MASRRIVYVMFAVLAASAFADAPSRQAANTETAWFQPKIIFRAGLRHEHVVALTLDDGPNANSVAVLDALKAQNVKATFFVNSNMARRHKDVLARAADEGHLLANHSASHPLLTAKYDADPQMLISQLRQVHDLIAPYMKPTDKFYFRAPYGYWKSAHAAILNADPVLRNYVGPIYWDIGGDMIMKDGYVMSSADWSCWKHKLTPQACAKGYLREIRRQNGGVVLIHSISRYSGELIAAVVPPLVEEGYRFVRLDQVPEYRQYETPPNAPAAVAGVSPHDNAIAWAANLK
jgi:peptidoglycan-N-acetylglucosamine deacetylase